MRPNEETTADQARVRGPLRDTEMSTYRLYCAAGRLADDIDALQAEVERLTAMVTEYAQDINTAHDEVERLRAENDLLGDQCSRANGLALEVDRLRTKGQDDRDALMAERSDLLAEVERLRVENADLRKRGEAADATIAACGCNSEAGWEVDAEFKRMRDALARYEAVIDAQAEEIERLRADYFDVARIGEEQAAIAIAQASKLAAVRALADEAREWGRGNPEVLFFEQDIRAVLDAEAEEDR